MSEAEQDGTRTSRWHAAALPIVAAVLPLATWPTIAAPFSTPKLWILALAVAILLPSALWQAARLRRRARTSRGVGAMRVPAMLQAVLVAWLASFAWSALTAPTVSPEALVLGIAGPLWCLLIFLVAIPFTRVAAAHVAGTTVVAGIALAQSGGMDPFVWWGWLPGIEGASLRMRVYGTLGNPNFVAALMAITIPLACALAAAPGVSRATRASAAFAAAVQAAALGLTGSRAGALGLGCGVVVFAAILGHRHSRLVMAGAILASVLAIAASGGRATAETLRGRVYIWQAAWAHAWAKPVTGFGPGAFELHYANWEQTERAAGRTAARDRRFAGPQQFAHNDYLQALVERGVAGLVTTVLALAAPILLWRRSRRLDAGARAALAGAAGAVAAFAALACFDFPLQRPAATAALWMAAALAWQASSLTSLTTVHTEGQTR